MDDVTSTTDIDWAPTACTLPTTERPLRVAEFDRLFAEKVVRVRRDRPTRLVLELTGGADTAATAAELAARETGCCGFFSFDLLIADGALSLEVAVAEQHAGVLAALADRAASLSAVAA